MNLAPAVDALVVFFEGLTPESVARFPAYYAADACFKDPFNEVRGLSSIQRIFTHLFEQVAAPRFVVGERLLAGHTAVLIWELHYRSSSPQVIRGVSHLRFGDDGKVVWHRDYWDAAEELYAKLPLLGCLMRWLQKRVAA